MKKFLIAALLLPCIAMADSQGAEGNGKLTVQAHVDFTMNSYAYVLRVTKTGRLPEVQVQTGAIYCHTFGEAAHIAMTDASMPWDEKRAKRELISIVKVDL